LFLETWQARLAVTLYIELQCSFGECILVAPAKRTTACRAKIEEFTKGRGAHPLFSGVSLVNDPLDLGEQLVRNAFRGAEAVDELLREILHPRRVEKIFHLDMLEFVRRWIAVFPDQSSRRFAEVTLGATDEGALTEMGRQGIPACGNDVC
jgi:hypothetical protein